MLGDHLSVHHRLPIALVSLIIASTLLPYTFVLGQVRVEQVVIYATAAFVTLSARPWSRLNSSGKLTLTLLVVLVVWSSLITIVALNSGAAISWWSVTAGFDTLLLPIATIIAVAGLVKPEARETVLRVACWLLLGVLTLSALFALAQPTLPADAFARFWGWHAGGVTVGELSWQSNRYVGLFNQPIEAGVAYGLGLFSIAYLSMHTLLRLLFFVMICTGGLLSGSKVFWVGLAVVLLLSVLRVQQPDPRRTLVALVGGALVAVVITFQLGALTASIDRLQHPKALVSEMRQPSGSQTVSTTDSAKSALLAATAGRFGSPSGTTLLVSPLGNGLQRTEIPADNAWTEASDFGGWVGIFLVSAIPLVIFFSGARNEYRSIHFPLLTASTFLVMVASVGAGSLFLNRAATYFWVIASLAGLMVRFGSIACTGRTNLDWSGEAAAQDGSRLGRHT